MHHLIDAQAREGSLDPLGYEVYGKGFPQEIEETEEGKLIHEGTLVAAKEKHDCNRTQKETVQELGQEEHGELHARVFDVETGDQFRFGLQQVERRLLGFRQRANKIDECSGRDDKDKPAEPHVEAEEVEILCCGERTELHATDQEDRHIHGQNHGDFIAQ